MLFVSCGGESVSGVLFSVGVCDLLICLHFPVRPWFQITEGKPYLGVDCNLNGTYDMKEQKVFETLIGKQQQFLLATQVTYLYIKRLLCIWMDR